LNCYSDCRGVSRIVVSIPTDSVVVIVDVDVEGAIVGDLIVPPRSKKVIPR